MPSLRTIVDGKTIRAYGTSEGVSKAWDTRGRGRKAEENESKMLPSGRLSKTYKVESTNINPIMEQLVKLGFQPGEIRGDVQDYRDPNTPMMYEPNASIEYTHPDGYKAYMEARMPMNRQLPTMGPVGGGTGEYTGGFHANDVRLHMEGPEEWHKAIEEAQKKKVQYLDAYGTSEGVSKAWDSRGRGRKVAESGTAGLSHWHQESDTNEIKTPSQKATIANRLKKDYDALKKETKSLEGHLTDKKYVTGVAQRWAKFWKHVGDWHVALAELPKAASEVKDLTVAAYLGIQLAMHSGIPQVMANAIAFSQVHAAQALHMLSVFMPGAGRLYSQGEPTTLSKYVRGKTLMRG